MTFILQKKNSLILAILFLSLNGCRYFFPLEPIAPINDKFMSKYGNDIRKARAKHEKSIKDSDYDGTVAFEDTAYGKKVRAEEQFRIDNTAINPYAKNNNTDDKDVKYLDYNYGKYYTKSGNIFNNIKVPKNDFKYYDMGPKDYNDINNIELQQTYDYIEAMNKERMKQIEINKIKEAKNQNIQSGLEENGIFDKTKTGLKNLVDKVKGLLD